MNVNFLRNAIAIMRLIRYNETDNRLVIRIFRISGM